MASQVSIRPCSCKHEFQDNQYGKGNRVFNKYTKGFRCTVCSKEHLVSEAKEVKDEKAKAPAGK